MNRQDAQIAIAALSSAARAAWDSDSLDGVDAPVIAELVAAGLVEHIPSWNDRARDVAAAIEPGEGVAELVDRIEQEGFPDAVDEFAAWTQGDVLDSYDLDAAVVRAIIDEGARSIRAAYDGVIEKLHALPSHDRAAA